MQSNPTLETILSHRSIRKFTEQPIPQEILSTLIDAGRRASTSNNLQCVSIIRVTDAQIREGLKQASGMAYYIGALRNQIQQVSDLVNLPPYCVPLVGLCLGYPAQNPLLKPRLPQALMCYENHYPTELDQEALANYQQELTAYYEQRTGQSLNWLDNIKKALNAPVRPHILPYFQQQGLLKK